MRVMKFLCGAACLLLSGTLSATSHGDLVAYDPFLSGGDRAAGEYTAGNDMRTMGAAALGWVGTSGIDGFGVSHSGSTGNFQANAGGEDSAAVSYEQGGRVQWIGVGNFPFDRNITRQLNPTPSSSEWWMSIMVNRLNWGNDPANDTFIVGGFTDGSGNGLQVGYDNSIGQDGAPDLVLRSNGINTVIAADTASSDNQYVLVKLDVNPAGNDTISIWADPSSINPLGAADLVITDQDLTSSLTPFTQSKYESPGQSGVAFFDEIRLATDFNSIVGIPEPATLTLLGLAFGLMGISRSRRDS